MIAVLVAMVVVVAMFLLRSGGGRLLGGCGGCGGRGGRLLSCGDGDGWLLNGGDGGGRLLNGSDGDGGRLLNGGDGGRLLSCGDGGCGGSGRLLSGCHTSSSHCRNSAVKGAGADAGPVLPAAGPGRGLLPLVRKEAAKVPC